MSRNRHFIPARGIHTLENERLVVLIPAHVGEGGSGVTGVGVRSGLSPDEELLVLDGGAARAGVVAVYDKPEGDFVVVDQVYHGRRLHLCCLRKTNNQTKHDTGVVKKGEIAGEKDSNIEMW